MYAYRNSVFTVFIVCELGNLQMLFFLFREGPFRHELKKPSRSTTRATPSARRVAAQLLIEKKAQEMFESERVESVGDLWNKMSQQPLLPGFIMVRMPLPDSADHQEVLTIRVEEYDTQRAIPVIRRNISVYPGMHLSCNVPDRM